MKRRGFTLIEMLIVIVVIMILATVTVGSFSLYRKSAVLDLANKNIASLIDEARAKVRHGKLGMSGEKVCFGLYAKTGDTGLWRIEWPYDSRDYYDEKTKEYEVGRCDSKISISDPKIQKNLVSFKDDVRIASVLLAGETDDEGEGIFLFKPPNADFVNKFENGPLSKSYVAIVLETTDSLKSKEVKIDLKTGLPIDD